MGAENKTWVSNRTTYQFNPLAHPRKLSGLPSLQMSVI